MSPRGPTVRLCLLACCLASTSTFLAAAQVAAQTYGRTGTPLVAPGLRIPSTASLPYALDHFAGKAELTPIHHTTVELNDHRGANIAGSLAGSFLYKPKMSVEVPGLHARSIVHDQQPVFYLHFNQDDPDGGGSSAKDVSMTWTIVRAVAAKDHRVFTKMQFTQLTGHAKRAEDTFVETKTESLPGGWL